jgi:ankyrin repeat protein
VLTKVAFHACLANAYRPAIIAVMLSHACFQTATARTSDKKICREIVQQYEQIKTGASTLEVNNYLLRAAHRGCEDLSKRLMTDGASLMARDRAGATPLTLATEQGWTALATLFLDRGAPIDARDVEGSTALFRAAAARRLDIVDILVERGADVNLPGRKGNAVIAAAAYARSPEMVELLLKRGADPLHVDQFGKSAMCYAAGRVLTKVVRVLLDGGVDVNARYGNGLTALMWAAGYSVGEGIYDAIDVIKLLSGRGAHIDDQDNRGRTALMIAAELGRVEVAETLIRLGADATLVDKQGKTARDLASTELLRAKLAGN